MGFFFSGLGRFIAGAPGLRPCQQYAALGRLIKRRKIEDVALGKKRGGGVMGDVILGSDNGAWAVGCSSGEDRKSVV